MGRHHLVQVCVLAVGIARERPIDAARLPLSQQHLHAGHEDGNAQGVELDKQVRGHGVGEEDDRWVLGGVIQHLLGVCPGGRLEDEPRRHP